MSDEVVTSDVPPHYLLFKEPVDPGTMSDFSLSVPKSPFPSHRNRPSTQPIRSHTKQRLSPVTTQSRPIHPIMLSTHLYICVILNLSWFEDIIFLNKVKRLMNSLVQIQRYPEMIQRCHDVDPRDIAKAARRWLSSPSYEYCLGEKNLSLESRK